LMAGPLVQAWRPPNLHLTCLSRSLCDGAPSSRVGPAFLLSHVHFACLGASGGSRAASGLGVLSRRGRGRTGRGLATTLCVYIRQRLNEGPTNCLVSDPRSPPAFLPTKKGCKSAGVGRAHGHRDLPGVINSGGFFLANPSDSDGEHRCRDVGMWGRHTGANPNFGRFPGFGISRPVDWRQASAFRSEYARLDEASLDTQDVVGYAGGDRDAV